MNSIEERGRIKAAREILTDQLAQQFGPLSDDAKARLEQLPPKRLRELTLAVLAAQSLKELGLADE